MKINVAADLPTNIAHVATFRGDLAAIARERGFSLREGTDDLDELAWMDHCLPSGLTFRLCKYRGTPEGTLELFFASQRPDWKSQMTEVANAMNFAESDIAWINHQYFKTP